VETEIMSAETYQDGTVTVRSHMEDVVTDSRLSAAGLMIMNYSFVKVHI